MTVVYVFFSVLVDKYIVLASTFFYFFGKISYTEEAIKDRKFCLSLSKFFPEIVVLVYGNCF